MARNTRRDQEGIAKRPQALAIHIAWVAFCLLALSPGPVLLAVIKRLLGLLGA